MKAPLSAVIPALLLVACGGGGTTVSSPPSSAAEVVFTVNDFDDAVAYRPASAYAPILARCATVDEEADACILGELPVIGMDRTDPTIEDVMDRVVVSHDWMGQRFREVLERMPPEMLKLFRPITAVVIDDDIRPSYYTTRTAAIYLDPAGLWLSNEEKATIDQEPDFRSGFASELAFRSLWRYVRDGDYAYRGYSLSGDETRRIEDIELRMAALLFHELAHANDFLPPSVLDQVDPVLRPNQAIQGFSSQRISNRLTARDPLQSEVMFGLAGVMFLGETATEAQKAIVGEEVGAEFEPDAASDDYAYSSIYEDIAMLFEETMMKYHFDVDRQMAFTTAPDSNSCADYIIGWGNHGRLGDTDVRARAQWVHGELLPDGEDLSLFFQDLAFPFEMTPGDDWCTIPVPGTTLASGEGIRRERREEVPVTPEQWLRWH